MPHLHQRGITGKPRAEHSITIKKTVNRPNRPTEPLRQRPTELPFQKAVKAAPSNGHQSWPFKKPSKPAGFFPARRRSKARFINFQTARKTHKTAIAMAHSTPPDRVLKKSQRDRGKFKKNTAFLAEETNSFFLKSAMQLKNRHHLIRAF